MMNNIAKFLSYLIIIPSLISCSNQPKKPNEFIFYPSLPSPPRIQYLTSFSSAQDLVGDENSFSKFIVGNDDKNNTGIVKPYGVSIKDGVIYLVDIRSSGFAMFDLKNNQFDMVHSSFNGKMQKPISIFIDNEHNKYVTDIIRQVVIVFDKKNEFVKIIGDGKSFKPSDVLVFNNMLFVTDVKNHAIQVFDKNSNKKLYTIGHAGSAEGELFYPSNIILSPDNNLYVSETGNFRIQEFTLDGKFIRSIGKVGDSPGQFARPKGISIDRDGNLYIVDSSFQNIQIMNKNAELLMYFGEPGSRKDNINLPADVYIDYDNISYFQKYAKPGFKLEYIILVTSQFGSSKLNVYGYGRMDGSDYSGNISNAVNK